MNEEMRSEEQVKAITEKIEELRQLVSNSDCVSYVHVSIGDDIYEQRICSSYHDCYPNQVRRNFVSRPYRPYGDSF